MKSDNTYKFVFTALCIAIGFILVQTGKMIPTANANSILLPMHIPVLICGLVCGMRYSVIAGVSLPLVNFFLTGMPILYPIGLSMIFELATYGLVIALLFKVTKGNVIISLLGSMIAGRIVYGIVATILYNFSNIPFGFSIFISGAFITALPGIVIQLLIIPLIWKSLKKSNLVMLQSH